MTPKPDPLTQQQGFALLFEQESARQLLAHGVHTLQGALYFSKVRDAVLTTLSIGVEKMLKVALGLRALDNAGTWPTKDEMRESWGHKIDAMDAELRSYLRTWAAAEGTNYVGTLIAAVDDDPVWPILARTLDAYGRSGRFYYLDTLGSQPQEWESPSSMWDEAERACIEHHPDLRAGEREVVGTGPIDAFDAYLRDVHVRLADSVVGWWHMVVRAGMHGALGPLGKAFGSDSGPGNALPPVTSRRIA
ncbi:hypothetical protein [Isoptericola sp. NPDC060257]|uniref:hypothetical protein n=1 Tax=Isoptericola sp. NPDC060257 TaxID=3347087 RepID=UPI00364A4220